jgi:AAA lid domain
MASTDSRGSSRFGSVFGESAKNTKAILKASEGKLLIIDEAYMLHSGGKGVANTCDPYKSAVIDTIVAEVQSTPGQDRCVLMLGHKEEMEDMLRSSNPGLARRFQLSYAFVFEDFDNQQLNEILELILRKQGLDATEEAKSVALGILSRARDRPNVGNAGEIENLISHATAQVQKRRLAATTTNRSAEAVFLPQDSDEGFDRAKNAALDCRNLFADVVGCEGLKNIA